MRQTWLAHSCGNIGRCSCAHCYSSLRLVRRVDVLQRQSISVSCVALDNPHSQSSAEPAEQGPIQAQLRPAAILQGYCKGSR